MGNKVKQIYSIDIDKLCTSKNGWDIRLFEAMPSIYVIPSSLSTEYEAKEKYLEIICKQSKQYHELKTLKAWRTIRLYDESGKQICQES